VWNKGPKDDGKQNTTGIKENVGTTVPNQKRQKRKKHDANVFLWVSREKCFETTRNAKKRR